MKIFDRRSVAGLLASLGMAALAAMLPAGTGLAGDEDMNTSAYLVFDPETGELVTVEDSNRTGQHAPREPAAESAGAVQPGTDARAAGPAVPMLAAAAALLVLIGAALIGRRRKQQLKS